MSEVKALVKGYHNIKRKPYKLHDILSQLLFETFYHLVHRVNRFSFKLCLCDIYQGYLKKTPRLNQKKTFVVFVDLKNIYSYASLLEIKKKNTFDDWLLL